MKRATGKRVRQVLEWLDQPWFHALCGNHDFMTWRSALGDPYPEVDHAENGGGWLQVLPQSEQQRIGARLAALPLAIEVATPQGMVGLIHADCPYDDWQRMHDAEHSAAAIECCLWSDARLPSPLHRRGAQHPRGGAWAHDDQRDAGVGQCLFHRHRRQAKRA